MGNKVKVSGGVHDNDPAINTAGVGLGPDAPVITGGIYEATPATYADGDVGRTHISSRGSTLVTAGVEGLSIFSGTANGLSAKFFANSGVLTNVVQAVKSSAAGNFWGFDAFFDNATKAFIQMFDVATAGAVSLGSTVADYVLPITPYAVLVGWNAPLGFTNGFQVALTTTAIGSTAVSNTALQGFALFK